MRVLASVVPVLALLAGVAAPEAEEPAEPRVETALAEARGSARELASSLKGLLVRELRSGGLEAAVAVCAEVAQEKTAQYRESSGNEIRRVSLRWRNTANEPDAYERAVLESFDALPVEERPKAEHWEVVSDQHGESLRYLKPLVANQMCLECHGTPETIPPEVAAMLAERYPDDRATGFASGDVRGAITIRIPLEPTP
jgi:hypothetical protein